MSRFRRVIHGVAAGYLALAVTSVYSLASVPLALHYLMSEEDGKKKFALWVLLTQVTGYLALVDLGMSGSLSRHLIDFKDDKESGMYGSLIKTGWLVMLAQSAIVFLMGIWLAPLFTSLLKIEPALADLFTRLLQYQAIIVAFDFGTRIFGQLLYAHQRQDISNYAQVIQLIVNFATMWFAFSLGQGVFSVLWAGGVALVVSTIFQAIFALHLQLFPQQSCWGSVQWGLFKEIFAFGKDLFLVAVGSQFIIASQTIVISRNSQFLGLEAVGLWGVGTKAFGLVSQFLWRVWDFSGPAFAEMIVREEKDWMKTRYRTLAILTASLAGWFSIIFVLGNNPFVALLTRGRFFWPSYLDILLAIWTILLALVHCHGSFVLWTKKIGSMGYVYFAEGMLFFLLASALSRNWGFAGIIVSSIICSTCLSLSYSIMRVARHLGFSVKQIVWEWQQPLLRVLAVLVPIAVVIWFASSTWSVLARFIANISMSVVLGGLVFLRLGLPEDFQSEILRRTPWIFTPLLRSILRIGVDLSKSSL